MLPWDWSRCSFVPKVPGFRLVQEWYFQVPAQILGVVPQRPLDHFWVVFGKIGSVLCREIKISTGKTQERTTCDAQIKPQMHRFVSSPSKDAKANGARDKRYGGRCGVEKLQGFQGFFGPIVKAWAMVCRYRVSLGRL